MKRIGIAAVAALACGACVAQTGAHEEDFGNVAPYDDMDVGLASEELLSDVEHVWHQGQPERWLMPASDGICVLTGVSGAFRGGGERVEVNVDPAWNWWRITGSSGQSGVSARAPMPRISRHDRHRARRRACSAVSRTSTGAT